MYIIKERRIIIKARIIIIFNKNQYKFGVNFWIVHFSTELSARRTLNKPTLW